MRHHITTALAPAPAAGLPAVMAGHGPNSDPQAAGGPMMGQGGMMGEGMLQMPRLDPARGRTLFAGKGCIVRHPVNGLGGEDDPPPHTSHRSPMMNPFDFAAKTWRGARAMVMIQHAPAKEGAASH